MPDSLKGLISISLETEETGRGITDLLLNEIMAHMGRGANELAVEVAKRAKAVVPHDTGRLQRSIRLETAHITGSVWERVILAGGHDVPYAHYQLVGQNRFSGGRLRYQKPGRQANYLYQAGFRPDEKSPAEIMLGLGRFDILAEVA